MVAKKAAPKSAQPEVAEETTVVEIVEETEIVSDKPMDETISEDTEDTLPEPTHGDYSQYLTDDEPDFDAEEQNPKLVGG